MLPKSPTNLSTIVFVVILSFTCALILSVLASALAEPKEIAKELDRSKQMLIAAKVLSNDGYFLVSDKEGKPVAAVYVGEGKLEASDRKEFATQDQILDIYNRRFLPLLVNDKGEVKTFEEANIHKAIYLAQYKKEGYYKQPWKLFYEILPNLSNAEGAKDPVGYVIPVNGYGLWDAIYGYLAIAPNGDSVIGITWYDQKETPGLGAVIAEAGWQGEFPGKKLFQESPDGTTDFKTAPLGITVVKGKVSEVLGTSPKAKSAVDGITGATLTGNGVNDAYKEVLAAYRPFLLKLHDKSQKGG